MNTNALAAELAAIAHQHYVTPDTLDQGFDEGLIERMQEKLKGILTLSEQAPAEDLTSMKTKFIMERDGMMITGFVLTSEGGNIGIADKSAVRWLSRDEMWKLMHPDSELRKAVET